jgi:hypothetical protein
MLNDAVIVQHPLNNKSRHLIGKIMKTKIIFFLLVVTGIAIAQETQTSLTPPAVVPPWKHAMIISANVTQISFTDWAQGGENSLAYALFLEGKSTYAENVIDWVNSYKFGFGQAKLGSQGIRKTDDKIDLESVLTYKLGTYVNPYASASLKTQFIEGVNFNAAGLATPVSNFFDPAYLTQSAGVGYQPMPELKTRLGAALREIVCNTFSSMYTDDPSTTEIEKVKIDGGIESVTEVGWSVMENVMFTSKLELFAPIKNFKQTTMRSDNTLSAKVNKFLSVNFNILLLNDSRIQPRTQVKQTLAVGFSYTLI